MLEIPSDQILSTGRHGALQEHVVRWVRTDANHFRRPHPESLLSDQPEHAGNSFWIAAELWPADNVFLFGIDASADAELNAAIESQD